MTKNKTQIIECPICSGNGRIEIRDRMKDLLLVFTALNDGDKQEVLFYADYLKIKRRKKHQIAGD